MAENTVPAGESLPMQWPPKVWKVGDRLDPWLLNSDVSDSGAEIMSELPPGPWKYGGPVDRDAPGVQKYPSMPKQYWEIGRQSPDYPPAIACAATEDIARLIAAVPELLAAAKELVEEWLNSDSTICVSNLCAAIAKAEGIDVAEPG